MSISEHVAQVRAELERVAVAADAAPMAAYMRDRNPYLGVKTPARRKASKQLVTASKSFEIDDVLDLVDALFAEREREFHYVGHDVLSASEKRLRATDLDRVRRLITTESWWDTVDAIAPTVGAMVLQHPELLDDMDEWIDDADFWIARVAIIHQLRFKERTDVDRLFRYCLHRAADREFFIRKAIGWALRQYARTDPDAVRVFVDRHIEELSPLSVREATKHL